MALIIRSSAIHAAGCYTTTAVRKGTRVAEYTGPRLSKDEADAANEDSPITYLFGLGDGSVVIDGHCMAMFINHSCDPNCETEEITGRVWIRAIRKIEPGEEITYDYCLYDGGDDEATCNCGARAMPRHHVLAAGDTPSQSRSEESQKEEDRKTSHPHQELSPTSHAGCHRRRKRGLGGMPPRPAG